MNVSTNAMPVSAKLVELTNDYMLVCHCGRIYRIDFDRYPYFRSCFLSELYNVQASAEGLHWPDADIDLEVKILEGQYVSTKKHLRDGMNTVPEAMFLSVHFRRIDLPIISLSIA